VLRSGRSIGTFPEGGLEPTPGLREFHLGGLQAAANAGVPVVPIGISGSCSIVAPETRLPRHGALRVEIGAPIVPSAADWESLIVLRDATRRTAPSTHCLTIRFRKERARTSTPDPQPVLRRNDIDLLKTRRKVKTGSCDGGQ
jgi:1-acyl-sn-glycerol-3-phosphate acyltransferase